MCDSPIVTIPDRTKLEPAEDVLPGFERGVKEVRNVERMEEDARV